MTTFPKDPIDSSQNSNSYDVLNDPLSDFFNTPTPSSESVFFFKNNGNGKTISQIQINVANENSTLDEVAKAIEEKRIVFFKEYEGAKEFRFDPTWIERIKNVEQINLVDAHGKITTLRNKENGISFEIKEQSKADMLAISLVVNNIAMSILQKKDKKKVKDIPHDPELAPEPEQKAKYNLLKNVVVSNLLLDDFSKKKVSKVSKKIISKESKEIEQKNSEDHKKEKIEKNNIELSIKINRTEEEKIELKQERKSKWLKIQNLINQIFLLNF